MSRRWSQDLWIVALALGVGACHSRPPAVPPAVPAPSDTTPVPAGRQTPPPPPSRAAEPPATPSYPPITEAEVFNRLSLAELNSARPLDDAFFDYDQATLREDARSTLRKDAEWLLKWKQTAIQVAGHSDERGTAEYNLALGSRRAAAVEDYLVSLGVDRHRVNTTSLGKEAPFCSASNESCWSQNRRGHFVITAK